MLVIFKINCADFDLNQFDLNPPIFDNLFGQQRTREFKTSIGIGLIHPLDSVFQQRNINRPANQFRRNLIEHIIRQKLAWAVFKANKLCWRTGCQTQSRRNILHPGKGTIWPGYSGWVSIIGHFRHRHIFQTAGKNSFERFFRFNILIIRKGDLFNGFWGQFDQPIINNRWH